jgi:hypothetical protein
MESVLAIKKPSQKYIHGLRDDEYPKSLPTRHPVPQSDSPNIAIETKRNNIIPLLSSSPEKPESFSAQNFL